MHQRVPRNILRTLPHWTLVFLIYYIASPPDQFNAKLDFESGNGIIQLAYMSSLTSVLV